jgi:hypothetical protein
MSLFGIVGADEHDKGKGTFKCREEICFLVKGANEINF